MRYTIDIDENGFAAYRGGPASKPRKSEYLGHSRSGLSLESLFDEIRKQGYAPGFGPGEPNYVDAKKTGAA
jgi:hypothetical protein